MLDSDMNKYHQAASYCGQQGEFQFPKIEMLNINFSPRTIISSVKCHVPMFKLKSDKKFHDMKSSLAYATHENV